MDRKNFISIGTTALSGLFLDNSLARNAAQFHFERTLIVPPYLKKGDTIGLCTPAGQISLDDMMPCVELLQSWGYKVWIGQSVGKIDGTFGGTDAERIADIEEMFRNPSINAIMCARGGYGIVRIIDKIDFSEFKRNPKWLIGFSDVSVLHSHIQKNFGIATLHAKMANSIPKAGTILVEEQIQSFQSLATALKGITKLHYAIKTNEHNILGEAKGILFGGNHRTLENLAGTKSDFNPKGKILFLEDVDEPLSNIDRMFWNLKRTGKLAAINGLLIGGYILPKSDNNDKFNLDLYQIVLEKVKEYGYPVCFNFPVGHQKYNVALKCGILHSLAVNSATSILNEL